MAGIYIAGLEMPKHNKNIAICVTIWANGDVTTEFGKQVIAHATPVHDHGNLIDRDEQIERAWRLNLSTREVIETMLKSAPTVIPANKEADNG